MSKKPHKTITNKPVKVVIHNDGVDVFVRTSFRLPAATLKRLQELAWRDRMSASAKLRQLVEQAD